MNFSEENKKIKNAYDLEYGEESSLGQIKGFFGEIIYFPYKSRSEINPSLKGINPPITLAQANQIAAMADAIGSDEEKSGWAIAISRFKETHKVENGRWIKKEMTSMTKKTDEEMAVEEKAKKIEEEKVAEEEEKAKKLKMAKEKEMAEKKKKEEEEKGKMAKKEDEKEDEEEDEVPEDKDQKMSLDANLDVKAVLAMLEKETDNYKRIAGEVDKPDAEINYSLIAEVMFVQMTEMVLTLTQMEETFAKQETEIKELKEYKEGIEKQQLEHDVSITLKEVEGVIPAEKLDELREGATKYSIENLEGWKNEVKAIAFTLTSRNKDEEDGIVKIGLPFGGKAKKSSLWNKSK